MAQTHWSHPVCAPLYPGDWLQMWTWNKDSDELVVTLGYGQSLVHLKSRVSWFEVPCSSLEWTRLWKWTSIFVFWWSWGESSSSCAFLSVFLQQKHICVRNRHYLPPGMGGRLRDFGCVTIKFT